jgi:hypothetical protein
MGHYLNSKKDTKKDRNSLIERLVSIDLDNKLYKPLDAFVWKDASRREISKESISRYTQELSI